MENEELDLRLSDVETLLMVSRLGSMAAAARAARVTPSQVSKAIVRLEKYFSLPLLDRVGRGAALTETAERFLPELEALLTRLHAVRTGSTHRAAMTVAAPSFVAQIFFPTMLAAVEDRQLRSIEIAGLQALALAPEGAFDVLLGFDSNSLGPNWVSDRIGQIRHGVFASSRTAAALGDKVTAEVLATANWVMPNYFSNGRLLRGEDLCPIPMSRRNGAVGVQSFAVGLAVAAETDCVVFGPSSVGLGMAKSHDLVELEVDGWDVRQEIFCTVNIDRVSAKLRNEWVQRLRENRALLDRADEIAVGSLRAG